MAKLFRSAAAAKDLREIWRYIANDNHTAADKHNQLLEEKFRILAQMPDLGSHPPELGSGLRLFSVGEYAIIYQVDRETLVIVRVVHGARNFRTLFP